jgi:hypothetical protein
VKPVAVESSQAQVAGAVVGGTIGLVSVAISQAATGHCAPRPAESPASNLPSKRALNRHSSTPCCKAAVR